MQITSEYMTPQLEESRRQICCAVCALYPFSDFLRLYELDSYASLWHYKPSLWSQMNRYNQCKEPPKLLLSTLTTRKMHGAIEDSIEFKPLKDLKSWWWKKCTCAGGPQHTPSDCGLSCQEEKQHNLPEALRRSTLWTFNRYLFLQKPVNN